MKRIFICLVLLLFTALTFGQSSWELRLMPQIAFGANNTLQRPNNDEGTRIFLNKEFDRKHRAIFSPRVELEYTYKRNHFILTGSLLKDQFEGISMKEIRYDGTTFAGGSNLNTTYRFNTYRIGYRYRLVDRMRFDFELGATLLIRDAAITMRSESQKAKYSNVGVAPLLSYYLGWNPTESFSLLSYGDGFAVGLGRAFDIFAGARYRFSPILSAIIGYRLLEGGSDVKKIYTMALFNYLSFGVGIHF
ncbi:hypothetical protein [Chryseobacterium sp.]|uniref:hypothetical protein n=1 Tax=Chryseobacterium sp. TaxID=1871047 RepID=UPI002FCA3450